MDMILHTLDRLRSVSRRETLMCSVAMAFGVVMVPLAYRGAADGWSRGLVLVCVIAYLAVAALRVARGFALDRQFASEERFVRLAEQEGPRTAGKIVPGSTLVQAVERVADVPSAEQRSRLRLALRRSSRELRPPGPMPGVLALIVLGIAWIFGFGAAPSGVPPVLSISVAGLMAALAGCEVAVGMFGRQVRTAMPELIESVVAWWPALHGDPQDPDYRHHVVYRDVAEGLDLPSSDPAR